MSSDRLQLFVFLDCVPVPSATLYDKSGSELSTRASEERSLPSVESDWRREFVDLSSYVGASGVYLMFVATSAQGNDIYLDNISIEAFALHTVDVWTTTDEVTIGRDNGSTIPVGLPSEGGSAELTIDLGGSATGFRAEEENDNDNFVTISASGNTLTINYSENPDTRPRRARLTLSTTGLGTPISRTISLTQAAPHTVDVWTTTPEVIVDEDNNSTIQVGLPSEGGSAEFTIDIGGSATGFRAREVNDNENFVIISVSSDMLTIIYTENTATRPRMAEITLNTRPSSGSISRTLSLTQAGLASTLGASGGGSDIVLYPNPVSGRLHIDGLQERALVRISTLGGRILRRAPVSASASSIDVSDLHGGTYVVLIESGEATLSRRLVIIE